MFIFSKCVSDQILSPMRHWAISREICDCYTGEGWVEAGQTSLQRTTFPRMSTVLRLRNSELNNFIICNIYSWPQVVSYYCNTFYQWNLGPLFVSVWSSNSNQCDCSFCFFLGWWMWKTFFFSETITYSVSANFIYLTTILMYLLILYAHIIFPIFVEHFK